MPRVRIVTPKEAIRVNYEVVRDMVPSFWDDERDTPAAAVAEEEGGGAQQEQQHESGNTTASSTEGGQADTDESKPKTKKNKYDFVLHIGMAGPQPMYQLERRGHRDGYRLRDVDGKLLGDDERHAEQGEDWIWHGVPHELLTDLDVDAVYKRWAERSPVSISCFPLDGGISLGSGQRALWFPYCPVGSCFCCYFCFLFFFSRCNDPRCRRTDPGRTETRKYHAAHIRGPGPLPVRFYLLLQPGAPLEAGQAAGRRVPARAGRRGAGRSRLRQGARAAAPAVYRRGALCWISGVKGVCVKRFCMR